MISILIPVYNFSVVELVTTLQRQATALKTVTFEIIVLDDGSTADFKQQNQRIAQLPYLKYAELPQNVGRSAIRNLLAARATGDYLLFMDCDSEVVTNDYLANYAKQLHPWQLLYGGRTYQIRPPADWNYYFHWKYGKEREETKAEERKVQPYHSFMTNNFLIPRSIFKQIGGFDERLRQYGHEDTVFGLELQRRGVEIVHLDNPLMHIGLERTDVFLKKTRRGIENLRLLEQHYPELETRLLRAFQLINKLRLEWLVSWLFKVAAPFLYRNLRSKQPKMYWFDCYKLGLLCSGKN